MKPQDLRIAILLPTLNAGGAERAMVNLARGLAELGFQVDLVLITAQGEMLKEVPDSVRLVDLGRSRAATSLPALARYLLREKPDSMLSGLDFVNILAVLAIRLTGSKTRLVISQRIVFSGRAEFATSRIGRLIPKLAKWVYPRADHIVGVSQGVVDDMVNTMGIPSEKVQAIYNPISPERILSMAQQACDHPWMQPGCIPVVLAVGRLARDKDFPMLIRAFSKVVEQCESCLIILGEGPERKSLESLVKDCGLENRVSLPGFVANPYPYMKRAAVVALSSQFEGLPGVLLEAMACHTPLVATDCPSGPREILQDGKLGHLVPIGDSDALAEAVTSVLTSEETVYPHAGLEAFEPKIVHSKYVQALFPDTQFELESVG